MKKLLFGAALFCAALFSSCGDEYDDTALRNEMESLKDRVAQLEAKLTQEVNALKGLIEAAEEGLAVSVEEVDGGYDVTIGNETFTIYHGTDGTNGTDGTVITVVEVDGVYYWAINGKATEYPVTGNDGKDGEDGEDGAPGQNGYTPEIKDGKWYINGEEVGPAVGENGKDGDSFFKNVVVNEDDTVTFTLADDTTITVALAKRAKYTNVQSIEFVPEYSDGKVTVGYYTGAADAFIVAKYEVIPAAAAELIAKYADDASMQAVYTKSRAEAGELVVLPVTTIEAEDGIITVTATAADLAEEFFAGTLEASVRFAIQDDLSGNASEYVAAVAEKVEMPDFTATAVAEGYQGVKLTWTEIPAAAYYQIKSGDVVVVEKVEGATEVVVENLTDTNKYAFTVVACAANDGKLTSADTEEVEIWTMYNWTEPVFELKSVENGYQFIASNLTNVNYAYGGAVTNDVDDSKSTIEIYKDNELVYVLKNGTGQGTLKAWAGYKRWALNAQDNRKDWTWYDAEGNMVSTKADGSLGEVNTVPASFFKGGEYTIKYKIGYVVNKNGHWAKSAKVEDIVANREDGAAVVFFANGLNDVLRQENGNVTIISKEGTSSQTFTIEQTWNVTASIDNGTVMVRELFRQYGTDWYNYGWYGERSVNGQFESVTLAWDPIEEADKVVIEYLGETVEVTTGLPFHIVTGLKTSPVEFTLKAYKGAEVIATATTSSDVYTLPETASGTFNATYSAEKGGWKITGEDFNTTQYATWNCSFNIYEKGSETPVFENPITKNGKNETFTYISYVCRGNGWVQASKDTFVGFHIGDGNWDQGTVFKGLKGDTEYEVRFELNVWPYIYDPNGPETDLNKPQWDLVKIMMTDDKATQHGAMKLEGTTTFTTGAGPAPFEVNATAEGYQGAKISWNAADGATGYEVYVGATKVAEAGADATEVVVTDLTDAQKYTFTVKALGADLTADTQETEIYTLCNWTEPQFELQAQEDGSYKLIAHKLANLNYAYAGMTTDGGKSTIEIYKGEELQYTLVNSTPAGTLKAWAGYKRWALNAQDDRYEWTWTGVNNSTGEVKTVPADWFTPGEYTIKYKIGYVVNKNGTWATSNNGFIPQAMKEGATHVYFANGLNDVLCQDGNVVVKTKEGTASFTVAAPAINWDYVCGAYVSSEWSSPYWNKDATQRYSKLGYGFWYNYVKLASECKDGNDLANPKDGQRYGLVYSWNNHIFFDIASTEINPETWQPQEGTGCYALLNMIDRSKDTDHIENNYSYYDKNEEAFYISFTLTSGGTVYRHDGKMHGRGTVALKDLQ